MKKKIIIKPFIPAMVISIEKWLTKMSQNGYTLIYNNGWKFVFVESKPQYREYCIYSGFDASKGIWADYYLTEKLCSNKQTKLSKDSYGIFEIDTKKDMQKIYQFMQLRKKYYSKHYCSFLLLTSLFSITLFVLSFFYNYCIVLFLLDLIPIIYAIVSLIIIRTGKAGEKIFKCDN